MEWTSVKDDLPKENMAVLIYPNKYEASQWSEYSQTGNDIYWAILFHNKRFYAYDFKDDCYCEMKEQPTHWMSLPEPPNQKSESI